MIGYGKSIVTVIILLSTIFITYILTFQTIDFKSHLSFFTVLPKSKLPPCRSGSPLRVFMYDLPHRFNVGLMSSNFTGNGTFPVTASNIPVWPKYAGLHQQHSVEYWLMTSLLYVNYNNNASNDSYSEVVRVLNGDDADVFFVPFFSSLSFNKFGNNMTDPDNEFDRRLQVDILKFLRNSIYWQRTSGRDHVIPMHHPNAFRFLREEVNASILIVADFGRYSRSMASLRKDVVAPYKHVVESYMDDEPPNPYKLRKTLLFFRGRTVRKSFSWTDNGNLVFWRRPSKLMRTKFAVQEGKVRAKLEKILKGYEDVHFEASYATGEGINASTHGMRSSKFCLHPAGDTPSSNRLFDAIVSHCVPVIVSDHIELPFESELDYSEFSIFLSVKEALIPGYMVEHLRKIPKDRWLKMWRRLKEITHHYEYQYPPKKDDAVNMIWRQVRTKVPAERLAVNRNRRLKITDWW